MILNPKFCSECGHPVVGKFCVECGTKILAVADESTTNEAPAEDIVNGHWEDEVRYEALIQHPEVRELIRKYAGLAKNGPTGEQFIAVFEKFMGQGVPYSKLVPFVQSMYDKWGISTGKERKEIVRAPIGRVIVRTLCSLARHGQPLQNAEQAADGCCLHAELPSDIWSFAGTIVVSIRQLERGVEVTAAARVGGSWIDWGKCKASLERFFQDVHNDPNCWK